MNDDKKALNIPLYPLNTEFLTLAKKSIFSISTDELRPSLTGAFVEAKDGRISITTTDGHRLTHASSPHPTRGFEPAFRRGVIVKKETIEQLLKTFEEGDVLWVGVEGKMIVFTDCAVDGEIVTANMIGGNFPEYHNFLPVGGDPAVANREALLGALDPILELMSDSLNHDVEVTVFGDQIELYAKHRYNGETKKNVPCQYRGEPVKNRFDSQYMSDALNAFDETDICLTVNEKKEPSEFSAPGSKITHILMPLSPESYQW